MMQASVDTIHHGLNDLINVANGGRFTHCGSLIGKNKIGHGFLMLLAMIEKLRGARERKRYGWNRGVRKVVVIVDNDAAPNRVKHLIRQNIPKSERLEPQGI